MASYSFLSLWAVGYIYPVQSAVYPVALISYFAGILLVTTFLLLKMRFRHVRSYCTPVADLQDPTSPNFFFFFSKRKENPKLFSFLFPK